MEKNLPDLHNTQIHWPPVRLIVTSGINQAPSPDLTYILLIKWDQIPATFPRRTKAVIAANSLLKPVTLKYLGVHILLAIWIGGLHPIWFHGCCLVTYYTICLGSSSTYYLAPTPRNLPKMDGQHEAIKLMAWFFRLGNSGVLGLEWASD